MKYFVQNKHYFIFVSDRNCIEELITLCRNIGVDMATVPRYYPCFLKIHEKKISLISETEFYVHTPSNAAFAKISTVLIGGGIGILSSIPVIIHEKRKLRMENYNSRDKTTGKPTGQGFVFEDIDNRKMEKKGYKVERSGKNDKKNGPDRRIDGIDQQLKCNANPKDTIKSLFDPKTKRYRYKDDEIVVPSDKYFGVIDEAQKIMENPGDYKDVPTNLVQKIKKGETSYREARQSLPRFTKESIRFDSETAMIATIVTAIISAITILLLIKVIRKKNPQPKDFALAFLKGALIAAIVHVTYVIILQYKHPRL